MATRQELLLKIDQLTAATNWAPDKQDAWLAKRGWTTGWPSAPVAILEEAIEYMNHFGKMFGQVVDSVPHTHNNRLSEAEKNDLRVYLGESEDDESD